MKELILDFETMGIDPKTCACIDLSVFVFDREQFTTNPYTIHSIGEVRRFKLSVKDQVQNHSMAVEQGVLDFWAEQSKEVRTRIKPTVNDLTLPEFVSNFHNFLIENPVGYWWTRGNAFDPVILERLFSLVGKKEHLNEYLKYWKVRDTRTYIDTKFNFENEKNSFCPIQDEALWESTFKKHDSSWDILADVLRMQAITRAENEMEQI